MARFIPYQSSRAIIEPTYEAIQAIEDVIQWAEHEAPQNLRTHMNDLCYMMALVNQKYARQMSFGPFDAGGRRTELAWKLPVRRISERYYLSWKVKSPRPAVWQLYNDSREAFFIEFGINWLGGNRRVRRPVRKLTLIKTLNYMKLSGSYHRIWASVFIHKGKHYGFTQVVQSPGHGIGWQNISKQTATNIARSSKASTFGMAGLRVSRQGFQRRIIRSGGSYTGPMLGRRLP